MTKKYYTRAEVQEILGLSAAKVKKLCSSGFVAATKVAGRYGKEWRITKESIDSYKRYDRLRSQSRSGSKAGEDSGLIDKLLDEKDNTIGFLKQQLQDHNKIIAMTQKNLNDLIQDHKQLKYENLKKAELIDKIQDENKHLEKLKKKIDKAIQDRIARKIKEDQEEMLQYLRERKRKNEKK